MRSPCGGVVARRGASSPATLAVVLMLFNEHHNPSENYTRLSIWQAALGMIDRFPLTGVGPFGFSKIYPLVRMPDGDATAFHAHSLYLTFFAEIGIAGLLAFAWMIVRVGARDSRSSSRAPHRTPTFVPLAIAAGVVGCSRARADRYRERRYFRITVPHAGALALAVARAPERGR